jgi:hypothetical protein
VRQLLPGDIKGWAIGTELDREGFKHIMHIELRRLGGFLDLGWERTEEVVVGRGGWKEGLLDR